MLQIVGGVYSEYCMHPGWQEVYGSGGRAASALSAMGENIELYSYLDEKNLSVLELRSIYEGFVICPTSVEDGVMFSYEHGLSTPTIHYHSSDKPIKLSGEKIIRYGMIEGDAIVCGEYVVYDPQNVRNPIPFHQNGSQALHLALVLNQYEARVMTNLPNASDAELVKAVASQCKAEVVVLKRGPVGALVYCDGHCEDIPAYQTDNVWKIGSGDTFVAHFGYQWMSCGLSPFKAADLASRATAYYCETRGFPNPKQLLSFMPEPASPSARYLNGHQPEIYLAGPFFTLSQRWMIEQARDGLRSMGLKVFSPFHDVGHGTAEDVVSLDLDGIRHCDLLFAVGDGLDAGTIYEIGFARALDKPVVFYSENVSKEDRKMMQGSGCILSGDFTTAIYKSLWSAISL